MTADESSAVVKLLLASYPTQRLRMSTEDVQAMFAAYAAGLEPLPAEYVRMALGRLVRTQRFIPTISEIWESTESLMPKREPLCLPGPEPVRYTEEEREERCGWARGVLEMLAGKKRYVPE